LGLLDALWPKPSRIPARPRCRYLFMVALLVLASCAFVDNEDRNADTGTSDGSGELSETGESITTDDPTVNGSRDPDSTDGAESPGTARSGDDCPPHEPDDAVLSDLGTRLAGLDPAPASKSPQTLVR